MCKGPGAGGQGMAPMSPIRRLVQMELGERGAEGVREESVTSLGPREQGYKGCIEDVCLPPEGNKAEMKGDQQERDVSSSHPQGIKI